MVKNRYVNNTVAIKPRSERVRSSCHDRGDMRTPSTSLWSDSCKWKSEEERKSNRTYYVMDGGVG